MTGVREERWRRAKRFGPHLRAGELLPLEKLQTELPQPVDRIHAHGSVAVQGSHREVLAEHVKETPDPPEVVVRHLNKLLEGKDDRLLVAYPRPDPYSGPKPPARVGLRGRRRSRDATVAADLHPAYPAQLFDEFSHGGVAQVPGRLKDLVDHVVSDGIADALGVELVDGLLAHLHDLVDLVVGVVGVSVLQGVIDEGRVGLEVLRHLFQPRHFADDLEDVLPCLPEHLAFL